jgi:hypothetical protein
MYSVRCARGTFFFLHFAQAQAELCTQFRRLRLSEVK